jgi:hypothetical protein
LHQDKSTEWPRFSRLRGLATLSSREQDRVREAIKVLASKGLVGVRWKTGTRVRPQAGWNMLDPEVLTWLFSGTGVPAALTDLLELRKVVEPAALVWPRYVQPQKIWLKSGKRTWE